MGQEQDTKKKESSKGPSLWQRIRSFGSIPLVESGAGALLGGALVNIAARQLLRSELPQDVRSLKELKEYEEDFIKNIKIRNALTVLGALLGGINPWIRDAQYGKGLNEFIKSMTTPNILLPKKEESEECFMGPVVDKQVAEEVVKNDSFLSRVEKERVVSIIRKAAEAESDVIHPLMLMRAAVQCGADFKSAYAFGRLGSLALGQELKTAKHISNVGALSLAVRSSGVLG